MSDYKLEFRLKPVVIQGGTYRGMTYTNDYSRFRTYNVYDIGQPDNELVDVDIHFDYSAQETSDKIIITVNGVKYFRLKITSVGTSTPFPVHDKLYTDNGVLLDLNYTSGVGYNYDSGQKQGIRFGATKFEINKNSATEQRIQVNKKLVRFDDIGQLESANNFIELWLESIVYIPPKEPDKITMWKKRSGEELSPPVTSKQFQGPKTFDKLKYDGLSDSGNTRTHWYVNDNIKPWAIRKSGVFKSHNRPSGYMKIRKSGTFVDKSEILESDVNQPNKGSSRIRKSGSFVGQNKIGQQ